MRSWAAMARCSRLGWQFFKGAEETPTLADCPEQTPNRASGPKKGKKMAKKWILAPTGKKGKKWPKNGKIGPKMGQKWPFAPIFPAIFSPFSLRPFLSPFPGRRPDLGSVQGNRDRNGPTPQSLDGPIRANRFAASRESPLIVLPLNRSPTTSRSETPLSSLFPSSAFIFAARFVEQSPPSSSAVFHLGDTDGGLIGGCWGLFRATASPMCLPRPSLP